MDSSWTSAPSTGKAAGGHCRNFPLFPLLLGAHDEAAYGLSSNHRHLNTAYQPGTILSIPHTLIHSSQTENWVSFNNSPKVVHGKAYKEEKEGKKLTSAPHSSLGFWVVHTPPPTPSKAWLSPDWRGENRRGHESMCFSSPLSKVCARLRAEKGKPCPVIPTGSRHSFPPLPGYGSHSTHRRKGRMHGITHWTKVIPFLPPGFSTSGRSVQPGTWESPLTPFSGPNPTSLIHKAAWISYHPKRPPFPLNFFWEFLNSLPTINFFPLSILECYKIWFFYKETLAIVFPCLKFCNCPPPSER